MARVAQLVSATRRVTGVGRPLPARVGRRGFLGAGVALLVAACSGDDDGGPSASPSSPSSTVDETGGDGATSSTEPAAPATGRFTAADFEDVGTCELLPEMMAGPFPLDEQFVRRDITEGSPGHPLRLGLRVVDASCVAVPGAAVEVWQADASGDYSAFVDGGGGKDEAGGTTFLRGTQTADQDGVVEFLTIYPGWYPGRAVHIHVRVHVDHATVLTSQLFFDEDYTEQVFGDDPYRELGLPDTTNAADGIAGDVAGNGTLLALSRGATTDGPGTIGLLQLGIRS